MIDTFSLLLTHGLIFLACWRLLGRDDLDDESQGSGRDILGRRRAPDDRGAGATHDGADQPGA